MLGQSFTPMSEEERLRRQGMPGQAGTNPIQEAIKVLSLRIPRVLGAGAPVSRELLTGPGAGGLPTPQPIGGAPSPAGPQPSPMGQNPFTPTPEMAPQQFENPLQEFFNRIIMSGSAPSPEAGQQAPPPPRVGIVTPGVEDPNPPMPTTVPSVRERILSKRENPWSGRMNNTTAF